MYLLWGEERILHRRGPGPPLLETLPHADQMRPLQAGQELGMGHGRSQVTARPSQVLSTRAQLAHLALEKKTKAWQPRSWKLQRKSQESREVRAMAQSDWLCQPLSPWLLLRQPRPTVLVLTALVAEALCKCSPVCCLCCPCWLGALCKCNPVYGLCSPCWLGAPCKCSPVCGPCSPCWLAFCHTHAYIDHNSFMA